MSSQRFEGKKFASNLDVGVSKNRGTTQIINFNRGFHYFHHPFWGVNTPIFGSTPMCWFVGVLFFDPQQLASQNASFPGSTLHVPVQHHRSRTEKWWLKVVLFLIWAVLSDEQMSNG